MIAALTGSPLPAQSTAFAGAQSVVPLGTGVSPNGVAVDAGGNVYVADTTNDQVVKAGWSGGAFAVSVVANSSNGISCPAGVAADSSGNVYIADSCKMEVLKETPSGASYTQTVVANGTTNGLNTPEGVAVDASGNVYIADKGNVRVLKEALSSGAYTQSVVASGLLGPRGVAVDANANVYIADANGTPTSSRVLKETLKSGSYTQSVVANNTTNGLNAPVGVAVDPSLNVYIADSGIDQVLKETLIGSTYAQSVLANHSANGLGTPASVAVDWSGSAYVADSANEDVLKVQSPAANLGMIPAGSTSAADQLTFTFSASVTLNSTTPYQVLAMGATGQEFSDAGTGSCAAGMSYQSGNSCTVNVVFAPIYAGTRNGAVVLEDSGGNTLATALMSGVGTGPQMVHFGGFEVIAATHIGQASDIAVDSAGDVYLVDEGGGLFGSTPQPYKLEPGNIKLPLGGTSWDLPVGIALDGAGNVYVSDAEAAAVYKIAADNTRTTVPIAVTQPLGVALDGAGNLFVADASTGNVYKMTPGGTVTTFGSNFASPNRLAVDTVGNLYVTAFDSASVYKITPAGVQTLLNNTVESPYGLAVDSSGTIYVASGAGTLDQTVYQMTQAGKLTALVTQTDGAYPQGITLDTSGNLYIADSNSALDLPSSLIYELDRADPLPTLVFPTSTPFNSTDTTDGPQTVPFQNIGNQPLVLSTPSSGSNPSYPPSFPANNADTNLCTSASPLAAGAICDVSVEFEPAALGSISASVVLTDNSLNQAGSTQSVAVSGTGIVSSQTITFTPPASPVSFGVAPITLSATSTSGLAVTFTLLSGPGSVSGNLLTVTGAGTITVAANQSGNTDYTAAPQVTQTVVVNKGTPSITWPQPAPIPNGTALSATQLDATASVAGTFVYSPAAGTVLAPGPETLSVTFTPTDTTDYTDANWSVTLTVGQQSTLASPTPGSVLPGSSVTFSWTVSSGVSANELWLGSTGVGSANLYNSGSTTATSLNVTGLPTNGVRLYARLWSEIGGAWQSIDYTYTEAGTPVLAALTSPTPGSVLPGSSATFSWTAGAGPTAYQLWLGTTGVGTANLYNSGSTAALSVNLTSLPTNGVKIYARLWSEVSGAWQSVDFTYTEAGAPVLAALTSPTPGSVLSGSSATFSWTAGAGPTLYELWLGTTGVGTANLYNSGSTASLSVNLTSLPTNGVKIYARLWSLVSGAWRSVDYTYTEAGTPVPAALTSPTPGSVLPGSSVTFSWTAGAGPTLYELWLGTTGVGTANLYNSGSGTSMSVNLTSLPTTGVKIYARLWSYISGAWQSIDYTYTEAGTPVLAALTSPTPGSVLPGSSVTFSWTAGAGPTAYELWLGSTGVGTANLYNSGSTTSTSVTVTGLPTNGVKIYARLWSEISGAWQSVDYTFTQAGTPVPAALTSPTPGSVLPGSSATFSWTTGAGPTLYELWLGTTGVGTANLYNSGSTPSTSVNVTGLPTTGAVVYARLWSYINSVWQSTDYTYTEQ